MPVKVVSLRALHRDPPAGGMAAVTREGEVVGTFVPAAVATPEELERLLGHRAPAVPDAGPPVRRDRKAAQAGRDEILRRVRSGGGS